MHIIMSLIFFFFRVVSLFKPQSCYKLKVEYCVNVHRHACGFLMYFYFLLCYCIFTYWVYWFCSFITDSCSKSAIWKFDVFSEVYTNFELTCRSCLRIYVLLYMLNWITFKLSYCQFYHPEWLLWCTTVEELSHFQIQ